MPTMPSPLDELGARMANGEMPTLSEIDTMSRLSIAHALSFIAAVDQLRAEGTAYHYSYHRWRESLLRSTTMTTRPPTETGTSSAPVADEWLVAPQWNYQIINDLGEMVPDAEPEEPIILSRRPRRPRRRRTTTFDPAPEVAMPSPTITRRRRASSFAVYAKPPVPLPEDRHPSAVRGRLLSQLRGAMLASARQVRGHEVSLMERDLRSHDWQPTTWYYFTERASTAPEEPDAATQPPLLWYDAVPRPSTLYLGVELEVEMEGSAFTPQQLCRMLEFPGMFTKRDGSLDDGLEMVTHPATLEAWHGAFGRSFAARCMLLKRLGYRSFNASSGRCGLHVHMARSAFDGPLHVSRFAEYIYRNVAETTLLARRTVDQMERYASLLRETTDRDVSRLAREKGLMCAPDRYSAVNTTPVNTVEVRIFRGTLEFSSILRTLQWLAALVAWTRLPESRALKPMEFRRWLQSQPNRTTRQLKQFLGGDRQPDYEEAVG